MSEDNIPNKIVYQSKSAMIAAILGEDEDTDSEDSGDNDA